MSAEHPKIIESVASKARRLPQGVRRHIRELKQQGKLQEAAIFARTQREKKIRAYTAANRLTQSVGTIIESNDKKEIATEAIAATWVLSKIGEITPDQRSRDLMYILDRNSDVADLESRLPQIRDEVEKLAIN